MGKPKQVGAIEIDQDLDHARTLWPVQRAGWVVMLLLAIAGLLGVFGNGPLASARAGTAGLTLEYDRFARHGARSALYADIEPTAVRGNTVKLWISQGYLEELEVESVLPEPESVESRGDVLLYTFVTADRSRPTRITLNVRPEGYWSQRASAGVEGGGAVSFRQFIYP